MSKQRKQEEMERLALIGVSYRRGGAEALEAWHTHINTLPLTHWLDLGFREVVRLSTCNRCDLLVVLGSQMTAQQAKAKIAPTSWPRCYAFVGEAAVEQLTRIAASLDSLNPGEDQIMMQVREAFAVAEAEGTLGKETRFAFTTASRIAKRVRREVELAPLQTSLFSLARPEMERSLPKKARIAVVGTGQMGEIAARLLCERPNTELLLVNRSIERAHALSERLRGTQRCMALHDFLATPPSLHGLVCATPVAGLFTSAWVSQHPLLATIVDLGLPRNVASDVAATLDIPVLDVDTLQEAGLARRQRLQQNLAQAEEILLEELDLLIGEWIERQLGPSIRQLRSHYEQTISAAVSDEAAKRLVNRMTHIPVKGLRALARTHGLQAARTFLRAAEIS